MTNEEAAVLQDALWWAEKLLARANKNPRPNSGTLGFLSGLSIALGGGIAAYVEGLGRADQSAFLEMMLSSVRTHFEDYPSSLGRVQ